MDNWQTFTGEYEKQFYELKLHCGKIIQHVWPNAGKFIAVDGLQREYQGPAISVIRPCQCGHKWAGCTISTNNAT